jgi:VWFA-related protein
MSILSTFPRRAAVAAGCLLGLVSGTHAQEVDPPRFEGQLDVVRLLVDVRVLDRAGNLVPDLSADDFTVEIDGEPAVVEAVDWFAETSRATDVARPWIEPAPSADGPPPPMPGRLVVVLVQVGWHRSRTTGLFQVSQRTEQMLEGFGPSDRVALAVFSSHLEVHHDFTSNLDTIRDGLKITSVIEKGVKPDAGPWPSLVEHLDAERAWDAATIETALEVIWDALAPLPGPKEILLVGWGIGRFTRSGIHLGDDWQRAFRALSHARASVFALDITDAVYHSLEFGLKAAAWDTGGTYIRMAEFPGLAIERLNRALGGRYELSIVVDRPSERGWYELEVEVDRPRATVLASPVVVPRGENADTDVPARRYAGR